jgi:hypothetical protein
MPIFAKLTGRVHRAAARLASALVASLAGITGVLADTNPGDPASADAATVARTGFGFAMTQVPDQSPRGILVIVDPRMGGMYSEAWLVMQDRAAAANVESSSDRSNDKGCRSDAACLSPLGERGSATLARPAAPFRKGRI